MKTVELQIEGMSCTHCSGRVKTALEAVPGAADVRVDLETGRGSVRLDEGADRARLLTAVEEVGYRAREV